MRIKVWTNSYIRRLMSVNFPHVEEEADMFRTAVGKMFPSITLPGLTNISLRKVLAARICRSLVSDNGPTRVKCHHQSLLKVRPMTLTCRTRG